MLTDIHPVPAEFLVSYMKGDWTDEIFPALSSARILIFKVFFAASMGMAKYDI